MSLREDEELDESMKIGSGDLLSFGNIKLILTLNLDEDDIINYKINWEDLKSLKNLRFIRKHKQLWKRVELSSNEETMNILLYINKTSKKLLKIGYVGYKKMVFKGKQKDFKEFLMTVTKENGLYLTSCDICECTISIQLLLKYNKEEKIFLLCGISTDINNNENNKDNKEKENNEENKNKDDTNIQKEDNEKKEKEEKEEEKIKFENEEKNENDKDEKKKESNEENKQEVISNINGNGDKNENKNEDEDNNPFVIIKRNRINAGKFNYIYFNFNDYNNGEFKEKIKLEHLFEYFQDIKIRTKSKIILNFEEEAEVFKIRNKDEIFMDLLSITDLLIFYSKKKLYEVLKELKEEVDKEVIDDSYKFHCYEAQIKMKEKEKMKKKEEEFTKKYKLFLEKEKIEPKYLKSEGNKTNNPNINVHKNNEKDSELYQENKPIKNDNQDIKSKNDTINQSQINAEEKKENNRNKINNDSKSENKKIQLKSIKPSSPKPLNQIDMFNYFKNGIFRRDPQKKRIDKIILVLDEFNKIFIVKCNKFNEKPSILDFDLKLYPQVNIRNMNDVLDYKNFIKANFRKYVDIFMGGLLGVLIGKGKEGCNEDSLFLGYLVATNIIKKIAEIERFNLPFPKNKVFFYPSLNKSEIDKLLIESSLKRKEKSFILDGNNKENLIVKKYNPLLDKNLSTFLNTERNKSFFEKEGLIGKNGKIMYDPTYSDTLGFNVQNMRNNLHTIQSIKLKKISKEKKKAPKLNATNKFLVGYRLKSPGYSIYNQSLKKKVILPPINQRYKPVVIKKYDNMVFRKTEENSRINETRGNISENEKDEKEIRRF